MPPPGAAAPLPEPDNSEAWVWNQIETEVRRDAESEPALASYLYATVLSHASLARSLAFHLANRLCSSTLLSTLLYDIFLQAYADHPSLAASAVADLVAARLRDPACDSFSRCLLNYKGFLAIQAQRVAHVLWNQRRRPLALALQSRISEVFSVDIHPPGDRRDRRRWQQRVDPPQRDLGGTGKAVGDRHPKIGDGVLIGAGATILGNVRIGEGAKVGAGSLVLIDVPPRTTAVGNPARIVGGRSKLDEIPGESMDHTSFISDWSDYTI
ncbi:unnamed protein product [Spirodela intermedia]|uniref:serine O-acetyltransferase n=1 Tax=Spirodela intermedia TaxID=51605 RepID=A0A7I8JQF2_SPIIN|nr:unnamed protein product [Spirodela intermedia]CAA6671652.1 unnamed protein product [Spirodela intermedia]